MSSRIFNIGVSPVTVSRVEEPVMAAEPVATVANNVNESLVDVGHFATSWQIEKVQSISLEQLKRTNREKLPNGQPMHGIYHFQLIETILQMAQERGLQTEITDMFAARAGGSAYPGVTMNEAVAKQLGDELDVRAYTLRRVFTTIRVKDLETADGEMSTALALVYTQKGIQVAVGRYVHICHNQTILGKSQYISTFSEHSGRGEKITFMDILNKVGEWLDNIFHISQRDDEVIRKMKATPLSADMLLRVIGELTAIRVACDSQNKTIRLNRTYPLNNTQINDLTEQMLIKYKTKGEMNVWDLYDTATNLYKARQMDAIQLLPQNVAMADYLQETFKY